MSRLTALIAHPRRTVSALSVVLVAAGVTVGSGANFTAKSANPANTFTSGTLTMENSKDAAAILSAGNLKPGESATGNVDIKNTGTLSGAFSLSTSGATNSDATYPILAQLDLKIVDCGIVTATATPDCVTGTSPVYDGKVSAVGTRSLATYAKDEKHRYKFDVTLPSATNDNYQGKTGSIQFDWSAVAV
ncbi:MAG: spore coat-associated protein [Solirubrobacteraceae bacterium]|jgi:spore coat-associated protein N|nr:spore coat-associated protein [Solirubrobacteraceae bacterium]